MKLKLLFSITLTLLLTFSVPSFSQVNSYFQNNPVWQIYSVCTIGGPCVSYETFNYYTNGDTLIDSLSYVKIYKKGQGYLQWNAGGSNMGCVGNFFHIDTVPAYFIRSLDKQMFVRQPGDTLEQLLYDFTMEVGDTVPLSFNNYFQDITISAIDSINTAFGYRKRFTLAGSTWAQYIIEGIGHSRGLVEPLKLPPACTFNLTCYSIADTSYFPTAGGSSCTIAIGINKVSKSSALNVYPNPFQKFTTFEFEPTSKSVKLIIRNTLGQEVNADLVYESAKVIFNRGALSSGIYFYEFKQGNDPAVIGKLMIEN